MHADARDPLIGRLIDRRYEVRSRIARGGMATVYEATDLRLDRRVAVKVMHAHLADDSEFRERFIQEAKSAARLAHPNVVNVFDQGEDGEMAYLVMEHLPSMTLRDLLLERGMLTPDQALDVLEAVLAGLGAAHRAGIVHRDLKPENILLANDGRIKIGDFGLARAVTANTATGKALLGTIAYLSPELLTRGVADTRSDIYAVGIMLFEMLTGKQPFTGEQPMQIAYQHANNSVPLPSTLEPSTPRALDALVQWATHRDPNLRPTQAQDLLEEVERVRAKGIEQASNETRIMPTPGPETDETQVIRRATGEQRRRVRSPASSGPVRTIQASAAAIAGRTGRTTHTAEVAPGAATALARRSERRRRSGWVWLALVLVVAIASGAIGWWSSVGPGAAIAVPDAAGETVESATMLIQDAGLAVASEQRTEPSYDVAAGTVLSTDPASGASMQPDQVVTLVVSSGRQQLPPPPSVDGMSQDDAQAAIEAAGFTFDDANVVTYYNADHAAGVAMLAILGDGSNAAEQATLEERTLVGVMMSAGPIPDVTGSSRDDAIATLSGILLDVDVTEANSTTVAAGTVISMSVPEGNLTPHSTVGITVSLGPKQVDVPNVVGMTITDATAAITAAGLTPSLQTNLPEAVWGILTVKAQDPADGTVDEGTTVTLDAQY